MVVPGEKMYQDMSYQISAAEDNERLWNDNHTDSIDEDLSNDVDHFSTLDEYYKHCSTFLDWGKLHGYGPQHFDSPPASSLLPTSNDGLNENKSFPSWSHGDSNSTAAESSDQQDALTVWAGNALTYPVPTDSVKKLYTCVECNKSYMRYTSLYRHQRYECGDYWAQEEFRLSIDKNKNDHI
ncbi:hypothetical protein FOCC_FOCC005501 [Frankliniella occidentalis]|nr:hypothetical protein FOCC_FOCC005501 [Frankliniella occidentalis]